MEGANIEKPISQENENPRLNHRGTISIKEHLEQFQKKRDFEIEMLKNKGNETYKFLEEVPGWELKFKKYQLTKLNQKLLSSGKLFHSYSDSAAMEVRNINDEFPPEAGEEPYASYDQKDSPNPLSNQGSSKIWQIRIKLFSKDEFKDILDSKGNLLPSRYSDRLAS